MENLTITGIRSLTDEEHDKLGWLKDNLFDSVVLELSDDSTLFAKGDSESNRAGHIAGIPTDADELLGATIEETRDMTDESMEEIGWNPTHHHAPTVLVLSTDDELFPTDGTELNAPTFFCGLDKNNEYYEP